jgi:tetratricopeptide (TPR) repeat protein
MSIIHEALQKIEAEKGSGDDIFAAHMPRKGKVRGAYRRLFILTVLLLCAVGVVLLYTSNLDGSRKGPLQQTIEESRAHFKEANGGITPVNETAGRKNLLLKEARKQNLKGIALFKAGNLEGAIKEFKATVTMLPSFAEAYNNLGQALAIGGKTAEAEVHFKKALVLRPDYPEGLNNYGALLNGRGESSEAIKHLRRAISIKPAYPDPYLNLAISLENSGSLKAAISYYNKYLEFTGSDTLLTGEIMDKITLLRRIYLAEVDR